MIRRQGFCDVLCGKRFDGEAILDGLLLFFCRQPFAAVLIFKLQITW